MLFPARWRGWSRNTPGRSRCTSASLRARALQPISRRSGASPSTSTASSGIIRNSTFSDPENGMSHTLRSTVLLLGFVRVALSPLPAVAQEYPAREIRSICNFAAGSGADILVRYYSDRLARLAGKPVLVENKVGAQGNIATEYVARAKPDGYTIMITPASSTLAAARHMFKQLSFDPIRDFTPVTTLAKLSFAIAVDAKGPIRSIAELTEYLTRKPGDGNYATGSNTGLVAAELYKEMAGTPRAIVDRLAGWFNQISASEETRKFLGNVATDPFPGNSESMAALIKAETENWGKYVRLAKIGRASC